MQSYDVVIIGGGIVGLTLACALQSIPLKIAVVETHEQQSDWSNHGYGLRVSAINLASQFIFNNLCVWDAIVNLRVSPFREIYVWDSNTNAKTEIRFNAMEIGKAYLGHIIENRVMQRVLWQKLQQQQNIELIHPAKPQRLVQQPQSIGIDLDSGRQLEAKLLVGADGANSWVRQHADMDMLSWSYNHGALVATVKTESSHQFMAQQCFLPAGPLAFLPLADLHHCSIVWSTTPEHVKSLAAMHKEKLAAALATAFESRLGRVEVINEVATFPLQMRHVKHYVKPRVALVGDAAHTIHPLAGQGMNLGLLDAACLAETIQTTHAKHRDIGLLHNLRSYQRWRKSEVWPMIVAMDGFKRLFASQASWIKNIRSLGLQATNRSLILKKGFMHYAMGLNGDLPALAKRVANEHR